MTKTRNIILAAGLLALGVSATTDQASATDPITAVGVAGSIAGAKATSKSNSNSNSGSDVTVGGDGSTYAGAVGFGSFASAPGQEGWSALFGVARRWNVDEAGVYGQMFGSWLATCPPVETRCFDMAAQLLRRVDDATGFSD